MKIRVLVLALALASIIFGCTNLKDLDHELHKMHSLNERNCIDVLGAPTIKEFDDNMVYLTWLRKEEKNDSKEHNFPHDYATIDNELNSDLNPDLIGPKDKICILKITLRNDRVIQHGYKGDKKACVHWAEILQAKFGDDTFAFID